MQQKKDDSSYLSISGSDNPDGSGSEDTVTEKGTKEGRYCQEIVFI